MNDDHFEGAIQAEEFDNAQKAEALYLAALKSAKTSKDSKKSAIVRTAVANFYLLQGRFGEANDQYELGLKSDDVRVQEACLAGLGDCYSAQGNGDKAERSYERAIAMLDGNKIGNVDAAGLMLKHAAALCQLHKLDQADKQAVSAMDAIIKRDGSTSESYANALLLLAQIQAAEGKPADAQRTAEQAFTAKTNCIDLGTSGKEGVELTYDRRNQACSSAFKDGHVRKRFELKGVTVSASIRQNEDWLAVSIEIANNGSTQAIAFPRQVSFKVTQPSTFFVASITNEQVAGDIEQKATKNANAMVAELFLSC